MRVVKPVVFHPSALATIRDFPKPARRIVGEALLTLQNGATIGMPLSRAIATVAPGVSELRAKDREGIYRVFYFTRSQQGILVFHAFTKKTQRTPPHEIAIARKRLKELLS